MEIKTPMFEIIFSAIIGIALIIYAHLHHQFFLFGNVILGLSMVLFTLWLGKQLKKVNYLNKELTSSKEELQKSKDNLQMIFDSIDACIWSLDLLNHTLFISDGATKIYGYSPGEFRKNPKLWKKIVHPEDLFFVEEEEQKLYAGDVAVSDYRIIRKDGGISWVQDRGVPVLNEQGELVKITGVVVDITERKQIEQKIQEMAYYDSLTELPNRYMLNEYLEKVLPLCKQSNTQLALLFLDLDRFKFINDTMGHTNGDILLKEITARLRSRVRTGDFIARLGGDEFIIILKDVNVSTIREVATRIIALFKKPFLLNNQEFFSSTSIGISLYPQDGKDKDTLIKKADLAMYLAKERGKSNYQFFTH